MSQKQQQQQPPPTKTKPILWTPTNRSFIQQQKQRRTLIPLLYPRRSPSPPATNTKPTFPSSLIPSFSVFKYSFDPSLYAWPFGTLGTHPSKGFFPSLLSVTNLILYYLMTKNEMAMTLECTKCEQIPPKQTFMVPSIYLHSGHISHCCLHTSRVA